MKLILIHGLGQSALGAVLALNYAVEFPEKTRSLFLIAPQLKMPKALLKTQSLLFKFMPNSEFGQSRKARRNDSGVYKPVRIARVQLLISHPDRS